MGHISIGGEILNLQIKDNLKTLPPGGDEETYFVELIKKCQEGDLRAMEQVYEKYKTPFYNLAMRFSGNHATAEDLLQDIFINIFNHINSLRTIEAFNGWAYRTAIHTCMSQNRKSKKRMEIPLDEMAHMHQTEHDRHPVRAHLEQAMSLLPSRQKSVFVFHDVMGFTHQEIAETMQMTEGTSKSQLYKARIKVRHFLRSVM